MVDGTKFCISYQRLVFFNSLGLLQIIQNLAPSTIVWRQCDIPIQPFVRNQPSAHLSTNNKTVVQSRLHICPVMGSKMSGVIGWQMSLAFLQLPILESNFS